MKHSNSEKLKAVLFLLGMIGIGCYSSSAQAKKKVTYYSVKAGTVIHVRLGTTLNSKTAQVGHTFNSTTVDPVYSSKGVVLIPAGSTVVGRVTSAIPGAKNGKPGTIDVDFTSVKLPNHRTAAINGTLTSLDADGTTSNEEGTASGKKTSKRKLKFIGGGAAGGAVIGGIAGGGSGALIGAGVGAVGGLVGKKLSKGPNAEVTKGTEFGVYLNRAISLPRYH